MRARSSEALHRLIGIQAIYEILTIFMAFMYE